jgi:alkylhydroperoxidase/carboxymuconolactone decarboxylase family protein YurZ
MNTPKSFSWPEVLQKGAPKLVKRFQEQEKMVVTDGAIPAKTKVLMMMLCDALLAHEGGVAALAGRARALGASEAEITETLEVAFLMGGLPALASGANAFREMT